MVDPNLLTQLETKLATELLKERPDLESVAVFKGVIELLRRRPGLYIQLLCFASVPALASLQKRFMSIAINPHECQHRGTVPAIR